MSFIRATIPAVLLLAWVTQPGHAGWIRQPSGTMKHLYGITADHARIDRAWACGQDGIILFTSDGGATWTPQTSGTNRTLRAIAFVEDLGSHVIAVGDDGTILVTHDDGAHWEQRPSGAIDDLRDISDFGYFAVGENGLVLRGSAQGTNWTRMSCDTDLRLNAVTGEFIPAIAADHGFILRTPDHGNTWNAVHTGRRENLYGIPMVSSLRLITGEEGLILSSTDFGTTWEAVQAPTLYALRAGEYSLNDGKRAYCVGDRGTILKTTDGGATWFAQLSGTQEELRSVFFYLDDQVGYIVGRRGTILKTTDGGGALPPTGVPAADEEAGGGVRLDLAGPNPFRGSAAVRMTLPESGPIRLQAYDVRGRLLETIAQGPEPAGSRVIAWDPPGLEAGVYYLRLEGRNGLATRRLMLIP